MKIRKNSGMTRAVHDHDHDHVHVYVNVDVLVVGFCSFGCGLAAPCFQWNPWLQLLIPNGNHARKNLYYES
jgi:hypothetical protein